MTREEAIKIIRKMLACTDLTVRANLNADMVDACHMAISTMQKYQRIEQIMKSKKMDALNIGLLIPKDMACVLHEIKGVIEDAKN